MQIFNIGSQLCILISNLVRLRVWTAVSPLKKFQWRSSAHRLVRFETCWLSLGASLILGRIVIGCYTWLSLAITLLPWLIRSLGVRSGLVTCHRRGSHSWSQIFGLLINGVNVLSSWLFLRWLLGRLVLMGISYRIFWSKSDGFWVLSHQAATFLVLGLDQCYNRLEEKHLGLGHAGLKEIFYF